MFRLKYLSSAKDAVVKDLLPLFGPGDPVFAFFIGTGPHFSGHGSPGALLFEDDEGRDDLMPVVRLIAALRERLPDDRRLPPFFYLATCTA